VTPRPCASVEVDGSDAVVALLPPYVPSTVALSRSLAASAATARALPSCPLPQPVTRCRRDVADGLYGRSHVDGDRHESGPIVEEHRDEFRPVLEAERDAVTALDAGSRTAFPAQAMASASSP